MAMLSRGQKRLEIYKSWHLGSRVRSDGRFNSSKLRVAPTRYLLCKFVRLIRVIEFCFLPTLSLRNCIVRRNLFNVLPIITRFFIYVCVIDCII